MLQEERLLMFRRMGFTSSEICKYAQKNSCRKESGDSV